MNLIKKTTCLLVSTFFVCARVLPATVSACYFFRAQSHHVHLIRFIDHQAIIAHPASGGAQNETLNVSGPDPFPPRAQNRERVWLRETKARRAAQCTEKRQATLERLRESASQRLMSETAEEREARLQILRENTDRRLSSETTEEREAMLQILRENADGRLSSETREARLQILRENANQRLSSETERPDSKERMQTRDYLQK